MQSIRNVETINCWLLMEVVEQKEEVVETVKCSVEIIMKSAAVGQNGFCGSTRKPEKNTR